MATDDLLLDYALGTLLSMTAESLGYEEYRDEIMVTDELLAAVAQYEQDLAVSLERCLRKMGRRDVDELVPELLDSGNASYNVLMTLRGEGVGIWDGRWDQWFKKHEINELQLCLEKDLRYHADVSGSGDVNNALMNAVLESVPEDAEYVDNYRRNVRGGSGDPNAARELVLFIDNTNGLSLGSSHGQGKSVRENLLKKWDKGTYDFEKSVKFMGHLADAGAKQYVREHGARTERWHETFDAATRRLAARELAEQFQEAAQTGEYSSNPSAKAGAPHYHVEHMRTGESFHFESRADAIRKADALNAREPAPVWQVTPVHPSFRGNAAGSHAGNARRASGTRYAAYFKAATPSDFRWLMRVLLDMQGVERGPSELQQAGFRDAPLVFPFDPSKNARVSEALSAAGGKIDHAWRLPRSPAT